VRVSMPYTWPTLRWLKNRSYSMKPRYDLPAPWSASVTSPCASSTCCSSGSMNCSRWLTCLSLRRLSWLSLPSRVRMCSSLSSSTDWPGCRPNCSATVSVGAAAGLRGLPGLAAWPDLRSWRAERGLACGAGVPWAGCWDVMRG
jgi:hypothetical protein